MILNDYQSCLSSGASQTCVLVQCGITVHKKCLEILHCTCDRGPASHDPVKSADASALSDHVPHVVTQCIAEIDKRGLTVRVSVYSSWHMKAVWIPVDIWWFDTSAFNPLMPTVACARPRHAVICNFWHPGTLMLSSALSIRVPANCPIVKNYKWRHDVVWHRVLYSCTHMATVGIKGLSNK